MSINRIAQEIKCYKENIILIYAFNGTGKTWLSREYHNISKQGNDCSGVFYNAYSEDLFIWNNEMFQLEILNSRLSKLHQYFGDESAIKDKLKVYQPKYDFKFKYINDNQEDGIEYVWFFKEEDKDTRIKISRGEERIFIWCFFLALFEIDDFPEAHKDYIFIDDPVSSLDDINIYLTAQTIFELFDKSIANNRKIIISTHHIGLFSILCDWLCKGDNAEKYKIRKIKQHKTETPEGIVIREKEEVENRYIIRILENEGGYSLRSRNSGAWLYHLLILQKLNQAKENDELYLYHFGMLRQVLETIASFIGEGRFGAVLNKIGEPSETADKINANTHKRVYDSQNAKLTGDNKELFIRVFDRIIAKYEFSL